jgi:hypothetical protein
MPSSMPRSGALGLLGLSAQDEHVYRSVLRHSGGTLEQLADELGCTTDRADARLQPLLDAELVALDGAVVTARPPQEVLGEVADLHLRRLLQEGEALEALRNALPSFAAEHRSARKTAEATVDVFAVQGGDVAELIRTLTRESVGDLCWLRPDQWRLPVTDEIDEWVRSAIATGRRSRAIYPARVLEEAPDLVRARAEAGEHVRILAVVPCRLSILGTQSALMPDRWDGITGRRLVVQEHSLVGVLRAYFDSLWDKAMAVPGFDGGWEEGDRVDERRLLLDQLASGAKDEQIARALGLSLRTVRRRVADLLAELGVESRFHAGVEAVRRGWI